MEVIYQLREVEVLTLPEDDSLASRILKRYYDRGWKIHEYLGQNRVILHRPKSQPQLLFTDMEYKEENNES